jgi:hypothetical protein
MNFKYHLIDLSYIHDEDVRLVDEAYALWESTYAPIVQAAQEKLEPDCFWRSKILAVITKEQELVGLHLYNAFDLNCEKILTHKYMCQLSLEKVSLFKEIGIRRLMSGEYLTVHPAYRGKPNGISWAEVIVGLSTKVFLNSPWDTIIGVSREDFKVDQMTMNLGGQNQGMLKRHEVNCKIIVAQKNDIKSDVPSEKEELINRLWQNRKNNTPWISNQVIQFRTKRAA